MVNKCAFLEEGNICAIVDRFVHPEGADYEGICMYAENEDANIMCEWFEEDK